MEQTATATNKPRRGNHPDWPTTNYAFWCKPIGEPPEVLFNKARQMNEFWNCLVACHDAFLKRHEGKRGKARTAAYKDEWYVIWRDVLYRYVAKNIGLNRDETLVLTERFNTAVSRAYSDASAGMPHFKRSLKSINIPFLDSNGGKPVGWFLGASEKRRVQFCSQSATRGHFIVDGESVPLEINFHRPLPPGCLIKRVSLTAKLERPFGWQWQLVFANQQPPRQIIKSQAAVIGVDLGFRRFPDRVRYGLIHDGFAYYELALPLDLANQRAGKAGKVWDIREVWKLESEIGLQVETCKKAIAGLSKFQWPAEAAASLRGIAKMREGGLIRLRRKLYQAGITVPELEDWYNTHQWLFKKSRALELQLLASREHIYRNLVLALAKACAVIVWEGDLNLKQMSEEESKTEALANAEKWRAFVGLSFFRQWMREACAKTSTELVDSPAAGTTNLCECGAEVQPSASLYLKCANGHRRDQDWGSARVLYLRADETCRSTALPLDLSQFNQQAVRGMGLVNTAVQKALAAQQ